MAIARLIAPYDEFRGRDTKRGVNGGNVVYSQGNQRNTRPYSRPFDPSTGAQLIKRAYFRVASTQWAGLSSSDVASWTALAATITRYNSVGMAYNPQPRNLYMETVLIGLITDDSKPDTASLSQSFPIVFTLSDIIHNTGTSTLDLTQVWNIMPGKIMWQFTKPLTPGTRSPRNLQVNKQSFDAFGIPLPFWVVYDTTTTPTGTVSIPDSYFAPPILTGQRIGVIVTPISAENNIQGTATSYIFDIG